MGKKKEVNGTSTLENTTQVRVERTAIVDEQRVKIKVSVFGSNTSSESIS